MKRFSRTLRPRVGSSFLHPCFCPFVLSQSRQCINPNTLYSPCYPCYYDRSLSLFSLVLAWALSLSPRLIIIKYPALSTRHSTLVSNHLFLTIHSTTVQKYPTPSSRNPHSYNCENRDTWSLIFIGIKSPSYLQSPISLLLYFFSPIIGTWPYPLNLELNAVSE